MKATSSVQTKIWCGDQFKVILKFYEYKMMDVPVVVSSGIFVV